MNKDFNFNVIDFLSVFSFINYMYLYLYLSWDSDPMNLDILILSYFTFQIFHIVFLYCTVC